MVRPRGSPTHTYVLMEVSQATYDEVARLMRGACYDHVFGRDNEIDMNGIAVVPRKEEQMDHPAGMPGNMPVDAKEEKGPVPHPTIGRIVHYSDDAAAKIRAAIITDVHDMAAGVVDLRIFDEKLTLLSSVEYSEAGEPFTWHYPARI